MVNKVVEDNGFDGKVCILENVIVVNLENQKIVRLGVIFIEITREKVRYFFEIVGNTVLDIQVILRIIRAERVRNFVINVKNIKQKIIVEIQN